MSQTRKYYISIESLWKSILKDIFTFSSFAGVLYFNHRVLNGSTLIDIFFLLIITLWMMAKNSKYYYSGDKQGAIDWLEQDDKSTN